MPIGCEDLKITLTERGTGRIIEAGMVEDLLSSRKGCVYELFKMFAEKNKNF